MVRSRVRSQILLESLPSFPTMPWVPQWGGDRFTDDGCVLHLACQQGALYVSKPTDPP